MALQTDGPISISDVAAEFGAVLPQSLFQLAQLAGIPTPVSLTDFYGLSAFTPYEPSFQENINLTLDFPVALDVSVLYYDKVNNQVLASGSGQQASDTDTTLVGALHVFDVNSTTGALTLVESIFSDSPNEGRRFTGLARPEKKTNVVVSENGQHLYVSEFTSRANTGVTLLRGRVHYFTRSGNSWIRRAIITPTIPNTVNDDDADSSIGENLATSADGSVLYITYGENAFTSGIGIWRYTRSGTSFTQTNFVEFETNNTVPAFGGYMQCTPDGSFVSIISLRAGTDLGRTEITTFNSSLVRVNLTNIPSDEVINDGTISRDLTRMVISTSGRQGTPNENRGVYIQYYKRSSPTASWSKVDEITETEQGFQLGITPMGSTPEFDYITINTVGGTGNEPDETVIFIGENEITIADVVDGAYTNNVGNNRAPTPLGVGKGDIVYEVNGQYRMLTMWNDFVLKDSQLYLGRFN